MDFTCITPYPSESVSIPDTYFSLGSDCITVRRFVPSHLESGAVKLAQDRTPSGETVFFFENYYDGNLALLLSNDPDPDVADAAENPDITVLIDHEEYVPAVNHGYMLIAGPFDAGCRIILSKAPFEEEIETAGMSDMDEAAYPREISADENESENEESLTNETRSEDLNDEEADNEEIPAEVDNNDLTDEEYENEDLPIDVEDSDDLTDEEYESEDLPIDEEDSDDLTDEEYDEELLTDEEAREDLLRIDGISAEDIDKINEDSSDITESSATPAAYPHTFEDAEIYYSEYKKRYVLKIKDGHGAHAILPGGTEVFARSGDHAFKGYKMRIGEEEYDLVVMKESALSEKAAGCNAYMALLGSFQGDCCYCIDTSHPEKSGTHGVSRGTAFIDNETGYRWGKTAPGCYEFELENGSYNVYAISASPEGTITSKKDIRKVSGGYLKLYSANEEFTHISITAADSVISENGSYEKLTPDEHVQEAAYLYIPQDIDAQKETHVSDDTCVAEQKTFKTAEFEHITTEKAEASDGSVNPYVFDPFEVTDETMISRNPDPDEEEGKYRISEPGSDAGISLIITPSNIADASEKQNVRSAKNIRYDAAESSPDNSTQNTGANIRISTYTAPTPEVHRKNADHINKTLKAKKAKNAATAAGIAAGAALIGTVIKALSGRRK